MCGWLSLLPGMILEWPWLDLECMIPPQEKFEEVLISLAKINRCKPNTLR